jgi:hypothetical protein
MWENEPGTVRHEAERLVFTALAVARVAAGGAAARVGHPESCGCPVCRTLAAVHDPDPALVEMLTSRAGDAAAGAAALLRSASVGWRTAAAPPPADDVWRAATTDDRHTGPPEMPAEDVWSAATRSSVNRTGPTGGAG